MEDSFGSAYLVDWNWAENCLLNAFDSNYVDDRYCSEGGIQDAFDLSGLEDSEDCLEIAVGLDYLVG